ncbi:MAG: response regulator transcription factor [Paucibacter sp.]|nr:response regulator transcription factor [Roseateles sp.]
MPYVYVLRRHDCALQKAVQTLRLMPNWSLAGVGTRGRHAAGDIVRAQPDIVACDLRLADGPALRIEAALQQLPQRPLVLLLADSPDDIGMFDALVRIGDGYAIEGGRSHGLMGALRRLASGRASMSPQLAQQFLARAALGRSRLADALPPEAAQDFAPAGGSLGLTRSDQHLLSLISHGMLFGEITQRWRVAEAEVERRVHALYQRSHERDIARAA